MDRKLRMGMVGGGRGAFIGAIHRMAANLDGKIELVCGAFSSSPETSKLSGKDLFLDAKRVYSSYKEMFEQEAKLDPQIRMDFVSIVTPNHLHFEPTRLALEHGFHVVVDKPLCFNLEEALALRKIFEGKNLLLALTYNYTGYPMVKEAKSMIEENKLGKIRKIVVEYPQGWLSTPLEDSGQKQASWRTDPSRSGIAGAMGDIGSHAQNLAEYISGLKITEISAQVNKIVEGRMLDDDSNVLLKFDNGAKGVLIASQISAGVENGLNIQIYGEKAGLEWHQMRPNDLHFRALNEAAKVIRTGTNGLSDAANKATRLPAGHPEGYIEAFANIYSYFANAVSALNSDDRLDSIYNDFPSLEDGIRGMKFIEKVIESGKSEKKWIKFE